MLVEGNSIGMVELTIRCCSGGYRALEFAVAAVAHRVQDRSESACSVPVAGCLLLADLPICVHHVLVEGIHEESG